MSIASRGGLGEDGVKIFNCQRVADKIYFSYETEKFNFIPETTFGKSGTLNGNFPPSPEYPNVWIKKDSARQFLSSIRSSPCTAS